MKLISIILFLIYLSYTTIFSCSMFYYIDKTNGKKYFVNNEDFWYQKDSKHITKPYIKIISSSNFFTKKYGRIWYGWDNFGQGGVNEMGLVLDGAITPEDSIPKGYHSPKGNITDKILAYCKNCEEAINYLEKKHVALNNAHIFFGDKEGNAVVVEWVKGVKKIVRLKNRRLIATNFHLSDTTKNYNCRRYKEIEKGLNQLDSISQYKKLDLRTVGNAIAKAVTPPTKFDDKIAGTLYTTFYDLTNMKLILVYKLDNSKIYKFDIIQELNKKKKQKIYLK